MKNIIMLCLVAFLAIVLVNACKGRKKTVKAGERISPICAEMKASYTSNIKSIIDKHCANSCHSAKNKASGIDLTTYENVKAEASMPRFLGALRHEAPYAPMPKKNPKLSDSTIQVISCWIETGSAL